MDRREALKGLAALGLLGILPKLSLFNSTPDSEFHIIGLGDAGSNVLQLMHKMGIKANYTCICSRVRQHLPKDIKFIKFQSPKVFYTNETRINRIPLTDEINELFKPNNKYLLLAGLGGYTGTNLVRSLMCKLIREPIDFKAMCTLPFKFEGPDRRKAADQILSEFPKCNNIWTFELELMKEDKTIRIVSDAFKKADEFICKYYIRTNYYGVN